METAPAAEASARPKTHYVTPLSPTLSAAAGWKIHSRRKKKIQLLRKRTILVSIFSM